MSRKSSTLAILAVSLVTLGEVAAAPIPPGVVGNFVGK